MYIQGAHDNITIRGNDIKADGELALVTESAFDVNNLTVEGNIFSGKTFVGAQPAGCGFSQQFTLPNVPLPLVYIAKGSGVLFSNNTITGTAGGPSSESGCTADGQGNSLVVIFGVTGNNATVCGNTFAGTTYRFGVSLRVGGNAVSVKNNTFNKSGLMGSTTAHFNVDAKQGDQPLAGADPGNIQGVASMNTFISEGYYTDGLNAILKSASQAQGAPTTRANSAPIAGASCATCLGTTAPNLATAPGDPRYPAGQQSASVPQNSGPVIFNYTNCPGGTVNWTGGGSSGSSTNGTLSFPTTTVGTVSYSATCTQGSCTSEASTVSVTVVADNRCGNKNQNVTICYFGVTQCVSQKIADRYLKLGATLGACKTGGKGRLGAEETEASEAPFELTVLSYPNPTQGDLTVEVLSKIAGPTQMQVLDLTGRAVQQRTEELVMGVNEVKFDLTAQPTGIYLIRAVDAHDRQGVVRVSKQ